MLVGGCSVGNAWLTPTTAPDGMREIVLIVPSGAEWEAIVRGALAPLLEAANFEPFGSYTADDTAKEFLDTIGATLAGWEEVP